MSKRAYVGLGNQARKVKRMYVGVSNAARKIKRAYIGVGDAARLFFSGEADLVGAISPLSVARQFGAGASFGGRALILGGQTGAGYSAVIDAYDASFVKSNPTPLAAARAKLGAAAAGGAYLVVAGGTDDSNLSLTSTDAYDVNLTRSQPKALSTPRTAIQGVSIGEYALFAGGAGYATVEVFGSSLTKSNAPQLPVAQWDYAAARTENHALIAGGAGEPNGSNKVFAYDGSLTLQTPTALRSGRSLLSGARAGEYAVFAGGLRGMIHEACVDAYDRNLTRSSPQDLSAGKIHIAAVTLDEGALFAGGEYINTSNLQYTMFSGVDVYSESLVRSSKTPLPSATGRMMGAIVGEKAVFAGGAWYSNYYEDPPGTIKIQSGAYGYGS